jgi:ABC-type transporter Mla subunit MlaD
MRSLELNAAASQRGNTLLEQLQKNAGLARDIAARAKAQRDEHRRTLKQLAERVETTAAALAPTLAQKPQLNALARELETYAQAALQNSIELEKMLIALGANVEDPTPAAAAPAQQAPAEAARFNNVELF